MKISLNHNQNIVQTINQINSDYQKNTTNKGSDNQAAPTDNNQESKAVRIDQSKISYKLSVYYSGKALADSYVSQAKYYEHSRPNIAADFYKIATLYKDAYSSSMESSMINYKT